MKEYSAEITDHLNRKYAFKISIDERQLRGTILYLNQEYIITQCCKSNDKNGLVFLMHLGQYIKVKVALKSVCNGQENVLSVIVGNSVTKYSFDLKSCTDYLAYVIHLNLPAAHESDLEIDDEPAFEDNLSFEEGIKPHLSVYLGWFPPNAGAFARFINLTVNNKDIDLSASYNWGSLGVIVPVGNYIVNEPYVISWKCETFYTPDLAKIGVGYFINNNTDTRKIMRVRNVSHYQEWTDSETIIIK